ncbi:energy transducer TonB [Undibacterium arcticum]
MKTRISLAIMTAGALLAGCAGTPADSGRASTGASSGARPPASADSSSSAFRFESYKAELAKHISDSNANKVYPGRPQALLRSVIVLKYFVDADGRLVHTDVVRSNHDRAAESTALASLKSAAPFPKPRSHLLHHGKVEISETWLFNDDGRFQLRSVAQPQINE